MTILRFKRNLIDESFVPDSLLGTTQPHGVSTEDKTGVISVRLV